LVVPISVQRRAGIKSGDRLQFKASRRTITIKAVDEPRYKSTKAELAAIRRDNVIITTPFTAAARLPVVSHAR